MYSAAIVDELANIPAAPGPYTISPIQVIDFESDQGVKFSVSGNVPLVKVAANPGAGQYAVSDEGVYTFAAADTGLAVKISYKLLARPRTCARRSPIGRAYRYRGRQFIGQTSKHMPTGETVTFQSMEMPRGTKAWPSATAATWCGCLRERRPEDVRARRLGRAGAGIRAQLR
jgi:hypothetical protein